MEHPAAAKKTAALATLLDLLRSNPRLPDPQDYRPAIDTNPAIRYALYGRVSTEDQARDGFSLASQERRLEAHVTSVEGTIAMKCLDEGHSGKNTRRPGYQHLMANIHEWDVLLVTKMDRVHRNSRNFTAMMDELGKAGKSFHSIGDALDTSTAMGRFIMDLIQRIAQLESDQIGERAYTGMVEKALTEIGQLGRASFGYVVIDGNFTPSASEAPFVVQVFGMYDAGLSFAAIAAALNDGGQLTKNGGQWTPSAIRELLRNVSYVGLRLWDGFITTTHEPIIEPSFFALVQAKLDAQGIQVSKENTGPGFLRCRNDSIQAAIRGELFHARFA